jgi:hypothetical protein
MASSSLTLTLLCSYLSFSAIFNLNSASFNNFKVFSFPDYFFVAFFKLASSLKSRSYLVENCCYSVFRLATFLIISQSPISSLMSSSYSCVSRQSVSKLDTSFFYELSYSNVFFKFSILACLLIFCFI